MSIWFKPFSVTQLNERGNHSMSDFLGIQFTEIGDNFIKASMPVTNKTKQPIGIVHGGANVVLAETLASTAANCVIDIEHFYCVGLEINANHIRSVREGYVTATTTPLHLGKSTQVWEIKIIDEAGKLTCVSRMTASVMARK
jgi:1,4-dihydroxy-2-naphthoyl-CoA hydrolase